MTRKAAIWLATALTASGLVLVALSSNIVQRHLQRLKYGEPKYLCLEDVGIRISDDWHITLLSSSNTSVPLIAGVFPAPFNDKQSAANVLLKGVSHDGELSIFRRSEPAERAQLLQSCHGSHFCDRSVSRLDGTSETIEIRDGDVIWINYLDLPVLVGLKGSTGARIAGIELGNCIE